MRTYKTKSLIKGFKLGKEFSGRQLVAVPTKYLEDGVTIQLGETSMLLNPYQKPIKTEDFADKFGRGKYTLAYFDWRPS